MPFYTYECEICDEREVKLRKVEDRKRNLVCKCGHEMRLKITATQIAPVHGGGAGTGFSKATTTPPA